MDKKKATTKTRAAKNGTSAKPGKSGKSGDQATTKASKIELDESDLQQVSGGVLRRIDFIK